MKPGFAWIRIVGQAARVQLLLLLKSWPVRLSDLIMPLAVAFVPILLGKAIASDTAGANFTVYTNTTNFTGFLLIGGGGFMLVTRALWGLGHWLRQEMQTGTLESLYLTPASMAAILAGVALTFIVYSAVAFSGAMVVGAFLFQVVFSTNHLAIAFAFLIVGLLPLYGLALLYGALVLRLKETDAFIQIAQWLATLLMGVYFPVTLFPPALKIASLLFPGSWLVQGLRSALLDIPYFSHTWWLDLAILAVFAVAAPLLAYLVFGRIERGLRTGSGLGEF